MNIISDTPLDNELVLARTVQERVSTSLNWISGRKKSLENLLNKELGKRLQNEIRQTLAKYIKKTFCQKNRPVVSYAYINFGNFGNCLYEGFSKVSSFNVVVDIPPKYWSYTIRLELSEDDDWLTIDSSSPTLQTGDENHRQVILKTIEFLSREKTMSELRNDLSSGTCWRDYFAYLSEYESFCARYRELRDWAKFLEKRISELKGL